MICPADAERFSAALEAAMALPPTEGIGRLNEGTLHRTLKLYFEPDPARHEIKIGRFVADVLNQDGIIEIQTRSFSGMADKLEDFLSVGRVTVVFPVAVKKEVAWVDPETGELSRANKSPKKGNEFDIFPELVRIKEYLSDPKIIVKILMMSITDHRLLCGWDESRKRGSRRVDRIPRELYGEITLSSPYDYASLIPKGLPEEGFTVKEFATLAGITPKTANPALNVFRQLGIVEVVGKRGRAYVYKRII